MLHHLVKVQGAIIVYTIFDCSGETEDTFIADLSVRLATVNIFMIQVFFSPLKKIVLYVLI